MRRVDDFLIDKVFQRIADALCRWRSCYGIAAFLLTGASGTILSLDVWGLLRLPGHAITAGGGIMVGILLPILASWFWYRTARAYHLDHAWEAGFASLPADRMKDFPSRIFFLMISGGNWLRAIFDPPSWWTVVDDLCWLGVLGGFYFMACTPKRPRTQRQTKWWGKLAPQGSRG